MIDHIIKTTTENLTKARLRNKKYKNKRSRTGSQADDDIMYCIVCNRCWEYHKKGNGNKEDKILYYNNFVTYGKERVVCVYCHEH